MNRSVNIVRKITNPVTVQKRGMAKRGWMKPNFWLDELAGRRETTYKTWQWSPTSLFELALYGGVPLAVLYSLIVPDMKEKDAIIRGK